MPFFVVAAAAAAAAAAAGRYQRLPKLVARKSREHLVCYILVAELVDVLEVRRPGLLSKAIGDQREANTRCERFDLRVRRCPRACTLFTVGRLRD